MAPMIGVMFVTTTFASALDSLSDITSLVFVAVTFAVLFLVLEGLDRI